MTFGSHIGLTAYKGAVGVIGGSSALVADAVHSLSDVVGTSVILLSCRISSRPADDSHAYGHGKAEFLGAAFIYLVLTVVGALIFAGGLTLVVRHEIHPPSVVTLLGALVSVFANFLMFRLGTCAGQRNSSPALLANAFENRADAISSGAVVLGIGLGILVHPVCDALAAMAVGVIIFVNCVQELRKALAGLMDHALPADVVYSIEKIALAEPRVLGVTFIKTRATGPRFWVDLGITAPASTGVESADDVAAGLRRTLMTKLPHLHTVEVFVSPDTDGDEGKE